MKTITQSAIAVVLSTVTAVGLLIMGVSVMDRPANTTTTMNVTQERIVNVAKGPVDIVCRVKTTTVCDAYLEKEVGEYKRYHELVKVLALLKVGDTINIHLQGTGGLVYTMNALHHAMKASKANVVTVLAGDVYSAHAALLLSGDEIRIQNPQAIIMIHRSSIYNIKNAEEYCSRFTGTDRRQSIADKCVNYVKAQYKQDEAFVQKVYASVLTSSEYDAVIEGYDVYLNGADLQRRLTWEKQA